MSTYPIRSPGPFLIKLTYHINSLTLSLTTMPPLKIVLHKNIREKKGIFSSCFWSVKLDPSTVGSRYLRLKQLIFAQWVKIAEQSVIVNLIFSSLSFFSFSQPFHDQNQPNLTTFNYKISAPSVSLEQSNFEHDKRTVAASEPQEVVAAAKADLAVQSTAAEAEITPGLHRVTGSLVRERVVLRRDRLRRKKRVGVGIGDSGGDVGMSSVDHGSQFFINPTFISALLQVLK